MAVDQKTKQIFEQIDAHGGMSTNPVKTPHDTIISSIPNVTAKVTQFGTGVAGDFYATNKTALDTAALTPITMTSLTGALTTIKTKVEDFYTHSQQVVKEFSPRIQAAEQYISNMKLLGKSVTGNPHTDAINSLSPTTVATLTTLSSQINDVNTKFQTMYTNGAAGIPTNAPLVKTAIATLVSAANNLNLTAIVTKENSDLDLFSSLSGKVFLAKILPTWYADSSTKTAVDIVATQSVKDLIK